MVHLWRADLEAAFGRARGLWAPRWRDSFLRGQHASAEPLSVAAKGLRSPANSTGDLHSPLSASLGSSSGSTSGLGASASQRSPFVAAAVAAAASAASAPPAASSSTADIVLSDKVSTIAPPLSVLGSGAAAHDGADIRSRFMLAHDNIRRRRVSPNTSISSRVPPNSRGSGGGNFDGQLQSQPGSSRKVDTDAALARALATRDAAVAQACSQDGAFQVCAPEEAVKSSDSSSSSGSSSSDDSNSDSSTVPESRQLNGRKERASFEVGDEVVAWGLIPAGFEGSESQKDKGDGRLSPGDESNSTNDSGDNTSGRNVNNNHGKKSPVTSPSAGTVVVVGSTSSSNPSENAAAAAAGGWHAARIVAVARKKKESSESSIDRSEVTGVVVKFNDARVHPALSLDQNLGKVSSSSRNSASKNAVILPLFLVQKLSHGSEEDELRAVREEEEEEENAQQMSGRKQAESDLAPLSEMTTDTTSGVTPAPVLPPPPSADSPPGKRGSAIVIDEVVEICSSVLHT